MSNQGLVMTVTTWDWKGKMENENFLLCNINQCGINIDKNMALELIIIKNYPTNI